MSFPDPDAPMPSRHTAADDGSSVGGPSMPRRGTTTHADAGSRGASSRRSAGPPRGAPGHETEPPRQRSSGQAPATSGRRLTRLLARWADARRLDPRQAEAIRVAARAAPVDLGFDWWWRLLDPENGSVFRVMATRPAGSVAHRPAFTVAPWPAVEPPFGTAHGLATQPPFDMDASELMAWPQEDDEYQPYLRLT